MAERISSLWFFWNSAFSDGGCVWNEGCGLHICMGTKLFRIRCQKTMENGADIPVTLWNCLSISSLVMKLRVCLTSYFCTNYNLGESTGP